MNIRKPWQKFCGDICRFAFHNELKRKPKDETTNRAGTTGTEMSEVSY